MIVENIMTAGLINVFRLARAKKKADRAQAEDAMRGATERLAKELAKSFNIRHADLRFYLNFRLGLTDKRPPVNPESDDAFKRGWDELLESAGDKLRELGIES